MAYTEAGKRATMKYVKENYDRIEIKVSKGTKEQYKLEASKVGLSLNAFVVQAIENEIMRNNRTEVIK